MIVAMAFFAVEDMLIKQVAVAMPTGQIFMILGAGGALLFIALARIQGTALWTPLLWHPIVLARTAAEVFGSIGFVTALALTPISSASAILQTVPLFVTMGAALFLGETVGWRRWTAIFIGLIGVLMIIRPGADGFQPASLFALQGAVGLAFRDIFTRLAPPEATSAHFSVGAFTAFVPTGLFMMWLAGEAMTTPDMRDTLRLGAALAISVVAYLTIITATRTGDISAVAPFRYTRIVFALIIGVLVFGERPDHWMLIGTAIVVGSGLFTLLREARVRRRAPSIPPSPKV